MCKLAELEDYTVVFSASGDYYVDGSDLYEKAGGQMWLEDLIAEGGVGVYSNGELLYSTTEENGFITKLPEIKDFTISREERIDTITINGEKYNKVEDGINIVVYDNVLGKVIDAIGFPKMQGYSPER